MGYTSFMGVIYGHSSVLNMLSHLIGGERRHHAWIFSGSRGIGKRAVANWFASQVLNCVGDHHDLHVIKKEDVVWAKTLTLQKKKQTNIPLDLLRERMIGGKTSDGKNHDAAVYKTSRLGGEKVFIIDEAELLDDSGQNALLKTLEEPPLGTTIILVTSRADRLLPTIHSRCQFVQFAPLTNQEMLGWVKDNKIDVEPEALNWLVSFSNGSPGLFLDAIETDLYETYRLLSNFLLMGVDINYTLATKTLLGFIDESVKGWLKKNPNTSKDAANVRAAQLLLLMFSKSSRDFLLSGDVDLGISSAGILVDVEQQLSSHISIKVLIESLAARWSNQSAGRGIFC